MIDFLVANILGDVYFAGYWNPYGKESLSIGGRPLIRRGHMRLTRQLIFVTGI